ncbi:MAG: DUF368 domain-containing protein [Oscillibacter sp.]|nr:DUF368 domain-containing protein [Oscillibacter sp.]
MGFRGASKRSTEERGAAKPGAERYEKPGGTVGAAEGIPARWGRNLLCGALIGAGAVLPGVSGGVLAVAFGLYGPLVELLSHPRTALPRYWKMLPPLALGWAAGFLLAAKGAAAVFGASETAATWLFIGLIAGTLPGLYREAGRTGRGRGAWTALALCALGTFAALFYVGSVLDFTARPGAFWYSVCGALWGLSVVLPGLTTASVLMALGLYQPLLEALGRLDGTLLAACVPSMALAAVLPARGAAWLLRRYRSAALHGILGMVAASAAAAVPTAYSGAGEAALSAACFAVGVLLAYAMERREKRRNVPA